MFMYHLLCTYQRKLFYPDYRYLWYPDVPYENLKIGNDEKISAWYFRSNNKNSQRETVLFCHGNTGNISHRSYMVALCLRNNLDLVLFDYRGFGESPGAPSQDSVCEDGLIVYDYMVKQKNIRPETIVIVGESLGSAVATFVAKQRPCFCLTILSGFSSLDDVILQDQTQPASVHAMVNTMKRFVNTMPNKTWIKSVQCPVLQIHSTEDEMIPYSNAQSLFDCVNSPKKRFISIKGTHSRPNISAEDLDSILHFWYGDSYFNSKERRSGNFTRKTKVILDNIIAHIHKHLVLPISDLSYSEAKKKTPKIQQSQNWEDDECRSLKISPLL